MNCYAARMAHRFSGEGGAYEGLTRMTSYGPKWTGKVRLVPEKLEEPLHWRKPRRIFVNSMSDLFHKDVPDHFIAAVFGVMAACPQHTFQILTKRPRRMAEWYKIATSQQPPHWLLSEACYMLPRAATFGIRLKPLGVWPLPNVHLGVSVENQASADERIPLLLQTPAAVRFISAEPLLGELRLLRFLNPCAAHDPLPLGGHWPSAHHLHQVIVGGESGPGARPCEIEWIRSIVRQCRAAGTACFVKQLGAHVACEVHGCSNPAACTGTYEGAEHETPACDVCCGHGNEDGHCRPLRHPKGGNPAEWPEDLRVQEQPGGGE